MADTASAAGDEDLLLDLLNSTPVVDGEPADLLGTERQAARWSRERGGTGSAAETRQLRRIRDRLQAVVRDEEQASTLNTALRGVRLLPEVDEAGVRWRLNVDEDRRLAVSALLAWGRLRERMPGRLRPCANEECRLFLLDHSRGNSARWCSMQICGNRLKVRRHYQRSKAAE